MKKRFLTLWVIAMPMIILYRFLHLTIVWLSTNLPTPVVPLLPYKKVFYRGSIFALPIAVLKEKHPSLKKDAPHYFEIDNHRFERHYKGLAFFFV